MESLPEEIIVASRFCERSTESIPRSKTTDNVTWNISSSVTVVRHPLAVSSTCRPQSAVYPTCSSVAHPNFQSIKHTSHCSEQSTRRRRYSRDRGSLYELSQDLQDKQLELLEKKYGGRLRSRHAARVIQRAYRRFSMQRKFDRISSANPQHSVYGGSVEFASKSNNVCDTLEEDVIVGRVKASMPRSTSATARIVHSSSRFVQHLSPSDGVYDNIPAATRSRHHDNPPQLPSRSEAVPSLNNRTVHATTTSTTITDGPPRRHGHLREHRSRHAVQSESPLRSVSGVAAPCPSSTTGNLGIVHSVATMSSVSICDDIIPSLPAVDSVDSSPVWKRLDELTDQDSGLGSSAQLSSSPVHKVFLDYDNLPPVAPSSYPDELMLSLPQSSFSTRCLDPHSPRRNSDSVRIAQAVAAKTQQRRAVSASRVPVQPKLSETKRKRQYRVGLNLFNKKPERGMEYLIEKGFVIETPSAVARFLISRKGLSKQKIGEYLGCQSEFCIAALQCFAGEVDLHGLEVDQAMRKFQTYFRLPGEAQKIERVIETFSHRYLACNPSAQLIFGDSINVLRIAYGIILLNTDLHHPSIKKERKMSSESFLKNLRGALSSDANVTDVMLREIYMRVKAEEFKPGNDHVSQVQRVDKQIVGDNKPVLPLPHRRLVCFCRLFEVYHETRKERNSAHQREVFLFNDLMVVTKQTSARKKNTPIIYRCRMTFPLMGSEVTLFSTTQHPNGLKLINRLSQKTLIMLNARNEHDRDKFVEDLQESIKEMDEMESIRIESELEKQHFNQTNITASRVNKIQLSQPSSFAVRPGENRDSGVADLMLDDSKSNLSAASSSPDENAVKRAVVLSNSLLDMSDQQTFKHLPVNRRSSTGSLDSGLCGMPGSSSASTQSTPSDHPDIPASTTRILPKPSLFGNFFTRKSAKYQM